MTCLFNYSCCLCSISISLYSCTAILNRFGCRRLSNRGQLRLFLLIAASPWSHGCFSKSSRLKILLLPRYNFLVALAVESRLVLCAISNLYSITFTDRLSILGRLKLSLRLKIDDGLRSRLIFDLLISALVPRGLADRDLSLRSSGRRCFRLLLGRRRIDNWSRLCTLRLRLD